MTHLALFYRDEADYVRGVRAFLAPALETGEAVACAVPGRRLDLLADALDGEPVDLIDMRDLGRNPARIIPAVEQLLERGGGRLHYVGEPIWADRSAAEIREATRHEALINLAWPEGAPLHALCPYDVCALAPDVLVDARRTHPWVRAGAEGEAVESDAWVGPVVPHTCEEPLPPAPPGATTIPFGPRDLAAVREAAAACAASVGLDTDAATGFVLAADEIATNSVTHGGGGGEARVWAADGAAVCEIRDSGSIADPLAGRHMPEPGALHGRGLWLAHQMCSLVEIRTGLAGTTVRLHASG